MSKDEVIRERVELLRTFYRAQRRTPSYSEMMHLFGYQTKSAVYRPVERLIALGYLKRSAKGVLVSTTKITGSTPLLGSVAAGFPSPAEEELLDTISLDEFLVTKPEATYLLKVTGDSMINAGIHPGDMVLVEKGGTPKSNDIVIAQVDGEWTMKYFGKDEIGIYLDPANAAYNRIRPERSLIIGGLVKAVIRKYA